jgi:hypothetical protein
LQIADARIRIWVNNNAYIRTALWKKHQPKNVKTVILNGIYRSNIFAAHLFVHQNETDGMGTIIPFINFPHAKRSIFNRISDHTAHFTTFNLATYSFGSSEQ